MFSYTNSTRAKTGKAKNSKLKENMKTKIMGEFTIDFLGLSPATYNALIRQKIDTPNKVANLTDKEIDRLRAIGDKRKKEVLAAREQCKNYKLNQYKVYLNGNEIGSFEFPATEEVKVELDIENKELRINY